MHPSEQWRSFRWARVSNKRFDHHLHRKNWEIDRNKFWSWSRLAKKIEGNYWKFYRVSHHTVEHWGASQPKIILVDRLFCILAHWGRRDVSNQAIHRNNHIYSYEPWSNIWPIMVSFNFWGYLQKNKTPCFPVWHHTEFKWISSQIRLKLAYSVQKLPI